MTKSEETNANITALLKSRHTLLWIVTREEQRVERAIYEAAAAANYETVLWDVADGIQTIDGTQTENVRDPKRMLDQIKQARTKSLYILRDLHQWLDPTIRRSLRNLAKNLQAAPQSAARTVCILTPSSEVPPELAGHATVINYPLPERKEIATILDDIVAALPDGIREQALGDNGDRDAAIDAAVGLTADEAANCYAKSIVTTRRISPAEVSNEKKRVIARDGLLEWYDPHPRGLDAVGGYDLFKTWLGQRRLALSQAARDFGLPAPKGCCLVGVPGCGKSLSAKAVAAAWGLPLLRLDMGAMKSKWVGESEANIRRALEIAETVAPAVLWLDEIEKALGGATQGAADGGVSMDALGAVLNWMQEHKAPVFVVATANDVSALPPELLRKGRFDEVFFIDVPTPNEREAVLTAALAEHGRDANGIDLGAVAAECDGFTGAEIAALVPDALFAAFADGKRALTTDDMLAAANTVVPLITTAKERIAALRDWAATRARPATAPEATGPGGRALDLG